jgi:CRP/FNR family transcriptional regulator
MEIARRKTIFGLTNAEVGEFLASTQMWQGLETAELEAITTIAIPQNYDTNDIIFWEGDEGTGFFLIFSGRVKIFKNSLEGKEKILHLFGAGDHFAEVPAFDGKCFPASAATLEATKLWFFPRTALIQLLQQHPTLSLKMLAIFAHHLRMFANIIADLSFKEVPGRLAAYLIYLSEARGNCELVELDVTKTQLAALLGTIPETLSRALAKLSLEGLIVIDGSRIQLLNRERLNALGMGKRD